MEDTVTDYRPPAPPALTRRQRLQRGVRHSKRHVDRQALVGAVVAILMVGVLRVAGAASEPVAVPPDDGAVFSATMVGDIMPARHTQDATAKHGRGHPFENVRPYLTASDYVTGNFESPVVVGEDYPEADKFIHFASAPAAVRALREANFSTVTLANNHMMDYGEQGLADTLTTFQDEGVEVVGAGRDLQSASKILYQEYGDVTVATLGFTDAYVAGFLASGFRGGVLNAEPETFLPLVVEAAENADLVIVHVHWGVEYSSRPDPRQVQFGRAMIDAGANFVVGHHPHVLLPAEVYRNGVIFYSLGNFVFDQGWSRTRESAMAGYRLYPDGRARVELVPLWIRDAQPRPVTGLLGAYRRARIFRQLTKRDPGNAWQRSGDRLTVELDHTTVIQGASRGGT